MTQRRFSENRLSVDYKSTLSCGALLAMGIAGLSAQAQEATGIEEVIVTAQKRTQNLQEVPVAVSAIVAVLRRSAVARSPISARSSQRTYGRCFPRLRSSHPD